MCCLQNVFSKHSVVYQNVFSTEWFFFQTFTGASMCFSHSRVARNAEAEEEEEEERSPSLLPSVAPPALKEN